MNNKQHIQHNDEIDLKKVFQTIQKYKVSILFITSIFFIFSIIFAYYQPNVYQSQTTVQINKESKKGNPQDLMLKALGEDGANIDDEIEILKSRLVVQKALETLPLRVRYYTHNKLNKKIEFYKDSPFSVRAKFLDRSIYSKKFKLKIISNNKYKLIIEDYSHYTLSGIFKKLGLKSLNESDRIMYSAIHTFGEEVKTKYFNITIKKSYILTNKNYNFNFIKKDDLYEEFISNLSVSTTSKQASILKIIYHDNMALRAKDILNAISKTYILLNIEEKSLVAELTLGFINKQLEVINKNLTKSSFDLEKYRLKNNIINLGVQVNSTNTKLEEYKAQVFQIQTEINILRNLYNYINNRKNSILGLTISNANFTDKTLAILITKLKRLANEKNLLLVNFTKEYPSIKKIDLEIKETKKSIKLTINNNLKQLKQRKSDLNKYIKKYKLNLNLIPIQESELAKLNRPLNINQNIYEFLLQRKAETAIVKSSTIASSRVIDTAREAKQPIKPKRKLIVIVGLILGLIVGISVSFFREFLINTIQDITDIESQTNIPIYGTIPTRNDKVSKNVFNEALRAVRTNLQFLPADVKNQIISITSSVSGEGKTTISAALAEIMVSDTNRVIILDLDLRKSSVHKEFNINNNIGVTNYLSKQNTLEEVIQNTGKNNLDIITTGNLPPNPSELILSSTFTKMLDILKEKYEYIILDTPPAGLVTDAVILMNYSDISFFVVRNNYSKKDFIKNIDKIANEHSNNKVGIILNGTSVGEEYGYGSYAYNYAAGTNS